MPAMHQIQRLSEVCRDNPAAVAKQNIGRYIRRSAARSLAGKTDELGSRRMSPPTIQKPHCSHRKQRAAANASTRTGIHAIQYPCGMTGSTEKRTGATSNTRYRRMADL